MGRKTELHVVEILNLMHIMIVKCLQHSVICRKHALLSGCLIRLVTYIEYLGVSFERKFNLPPFLLFLFSLYLYSASCNS